ncbi:unnamed protein product [Lactuca saligna]|uniref:Uncharacterized protein n=1 Tax=Lactuca saligna TaxID=75948 RepID=A0AA35Y6A6_LACSI|nr:unnamed protein product [Lactuca saligna]
MLGYPVWEAFHVSWAESVGRSKVAFTTVAVRKVEVVITSSPRSSIAATSPGHRPSTVEVGNHQADVAIVPVATNDDEPHTLLIFLYMTTSPLVSGGLSTPLTPYVRRMLP